MSYTVCSTTRSMSIKNYSYLWHHLNDVFERSYGDSDSCYFNDESAYFPFDSSFNIPFNFGAIHYGVTDSEMIYNVDLSLKLRERRLKCGTQYNKPMHTEKCACDCTLEKCSNPSGCCKSTAVCHAVSMYCQSTDVDIKTVKRLCESGIQLDVFALSINPSISMDDICNTPCIDWQPFLVSLRNDIRLDHFTSKNKHLFCVEILCENERIPFSLLEHLALMHEYRNSLNMITIALRNDVTSDDVDNHSFMPWVESCIDRRTLGTHKRSFILPSGERYTVSLESFDQINGKYLCNCKSYSSISHYYESDDESDDDESEDNEY